MDHITTPFGRRTLSLDMVAAQVAARDIEGKAALKWKTFRLITECREALDVTDRDLVVLNALLTCLPETAMSAGELVVYPSNKALSLRAHGMAETTLRRHLAALVKAGLVIRRDSPNGKRYARKDGAGEVEIAYGFDLSPVLARAEEFENLAAEIAVERRRAAMARERVTIYRRDIAKMIEAGGAGEPWQGYRAAFSALCYRLPGRSHRPASSRSSTPCMRSRSRSARLWKGAFRIRLWTAMTRKTARISEIQNPILSLFLIRLSIRQLSGPKELCRWPWCGKHARTS